MHQNSNLKWINSNWNEGDRSTVWNENDCIPVLNENEWIPICNEINRWIWKEKKSKTEAKVEQKWLNYDVDLKWMQYRTKLRWKWMSALNEKTKEIKV